MMFLLEIDEAEKSAKGLNAEVTFSENFKQKLDSFIIKTLDESKNRSLSKKQNSNSKMNHTLSREEREKEADIRLINNNYQQVHPYIKHKKELIRMFHKYFPNEFNINRLRKINNSRIKLFKEKVGKKKIKDSSNLKEKDNNLNFITEEKNKENIDKKEENSNISKQKSSEILKMNENITDEDKNNYEFFEMEKVRKGVLKISLTEPQKKNLLVYAKKGPRYSESVIKQNKKVLEEFQYFCSQMNLKPFPLNSTTAVAFLHFLGKTKQYCVRSLESVVTYALYRLHLEKTLTPVDKYTIACMRSEINSLYKDKTCKQSTDGMTPLISEDLKIIIENIPDCDPEKPKLASLFLFSLSTGSRASTCAGVRLCHLVHYYCRNDRYGNYALVIKQDVRKSPKLLYKTVTISGNPEKKETLNVIYWLEQYLIKYFGINIKDLVNYNLLHSEERQEFLWPLKPYSMSMHLKRKVRYAGLNIKKVGMHSLRSGFLASAILSSEANNEGFKGIMERCAVVADWEPYSYAQILYMKAVTRQALVSTDLIGITQTDENGLKTTRSSINFHQITTNPTPSTKLYSFLVINKLKQFLGYPLTLDKTNQRNFNKMYYYSLNKYGKALFCKESLKFNERRKKLIKYIDVKVKEKDDNIEKIAKDLFDILENNNKIIKYVEVKKEEEEPSYSELRNEKLSELIGKKVLRAGWTEKEDEIFKKLIGERKSISEIQKALYFRNAKNCYDHLRSINYKRVSQGLTKITLNRSEIKERRRKVKTEEKSKSSSSKENNENTNEKRTSPDTTSLKDERSSQSSNKINNMYVNSSVMNYYMNKASKVSTDINKNNNTSSNETTKICNPCKYPSPLNYGCVYIPVYYPIRSPIPSPLDNNYNSVLNTCLSSLPQFNQIHITPYLTPFSSNCNFFNPTVSNLIPQVDSNITQNNNNTSQTHSNKN